MGYDSTAPITEAVGAWLNMEVPMSIRDWPAAERPREKLLEQGAASLTDAELLAIFLRTGVTGKSAVDLARYLLSEFGSLRALLEADLTLASGAPAKCVFRQGPSLARRTRLELRTVAGLWEQDNDILKRNGSNQTLLGPGSLFDRDQRVATARILEGAPPYVTEERVLHVLDVVERLGLRRTGAVPPMAEVGGAP